MDLVPIDFDFVDRWPHPHPHPHPPPLPSLTPTPATKNNSTSFPKVTIENLECWHQRHSKNWRTLKFGNFCDVSYEDLLLKNLFAEVIRVELQNKVRILYSKYFYHIKCNLWEEAVQNMHITQNRKEQQADLLSFITVMDNVRGRKDETGPFGITSNTTYEDFEE
ncbi:hypothetical protein RHMOL_Rhmol06G0153700 [Rhododendron molle]|uniref:Uncharacterized protein n=3 Tax=Rhododendron molle TaxID=49168 RepID=A0ACC0NCR4_RHOML|nr:hypothetical protein RHMOL_Rhmol06G0153700 [Rhododendron molle]KAI8551037.1 hypothetical protein RHMOL_Rhmol06G0153700 [Rhododendron molle]KAI8551038.1 hypothetical protein RHMOL_Rhmol06G0153700 [Rhododendron molle]